MCLTEGLFDVREGVRVASVLGHEAKCVHHRVCRVCCPALEEFNARDDVYGALLGEDSSLADVVEDEQAHSHSAEAELLCCRVGYLVVGDHPAAALGKAGQNLVDLSSAGTRVRGEELSRRVDDNAGHRAGVGIEQGHAVDNLVADLALSGLPLALQTGEDTAVVRQVVLDGRIHHLHVVKAGAKVQHLAEDLGQRLVAGQSGICLANTQSGIDTRKVLLKLGAHVKEVLQLGNAHTHSRPGSSFRGLAGTADGRPDKLTTALIRIKVLQNIREISQNSVQLCLKGRIALG